MHMRQYFLTHPKRANTELKLVWLVIMTDLCPKIIFRNELSVLKTVPHGHRYNATTSEKCIWRIWSDRVDLHLLIVQITVDLLSGWIENATTPLLYIKCNRIFLLSWVLIKEKERRPLKIIIAKVSNGDKRFCDSRGWSHKKAWSSLRASSGRSCPSCVNAHGSYVRELNRGNVCVVAGKRKSWA